MRRALSLALTLWASSAYAQARDEDMSPRAVALMSEGTRQLRAHAHEQALANFLEAYATSPRPEILLEIGQALREMSRPADAANTYQRYLADAAPERVAEVKELLAKLDQELTVLTIRVSPRGSEVSIDAGPFVAVGVTMRTRVRPGVHLVRVRKGSASTELDIHGFEGESKEVAATLVTDDAVPTPTPATLPSANDSLPSIVEQAPDTVDGWLITGRQYTYGSGAQRGVLGGYGGDVVQPIVPPYEVEADGTVTVDAPVERKLGTGVIGVMRIDGKGRGVAGGLGIVLAPLDRVELELAGLKAEDWGVYAGLRVRFLSGWLRPYVGGGVPLFFYPDDTTMGSAVALGLRASGGVEVKLNNHISVQADAGIEHFFNIKDALVHGKRPDETVFVPTVGVIGRL